LKKKVAWVLMYRAASGTRNAIVPADGENTTHRSCERYVAVPQFVERHGLADATQAKKDERLHGGAKALRPRTGILVALPLPTCRREKAG